MTPEQTLKQLYDNVNKIGKWLVRLLIKELRDQGHDLTGSLVASVVEEVDETLEDVELRIRHNLYGAYLNKGTSPARIPFSGAKRRRQRSASPRRSKYIEALIKWIRLAKFTSGLDKDIKSTAFAIATKQKKYGNPIPWRFLSTRAKGISKNQRRRGWLDWTIKTYGVELQDQVTEAQSTFIQDFSEALILKIANKNPEILFVTRS